MVLKSVPAERPIRLQSVQRSAVRLKSVTRPKRKAPKKLEGQALERAADLARSLRTATEQWQQANFRQRVEIKQGLKSKLSGDLVPPKSWAGRGLQLLRQQAQGQCHYCQGTGHQAFLCRRTSPPCVGADAAQARGKRGHKDRGRGRRGGGVFRRTPSGPRPFEAPSF